MEIAIAVFIGAWTIAAGLCAYKRLKKEYEENNVKGKKAS